MIRRTFDPVEVNAILNDPEVFKWIKTPALKTVDISDLVLNFHNIFLMVQGGCIIFFHQEPGVYEVHTNFLADWRGSNAVRQSVAAYRWMFTRTDCMILQTKVPAFNKAAELFCRIVGATKDFERKAVWPTESGPVDMSYWTLKYEDWVRKAFSLMKVGKEFHDHLDIELARHGTKQESHPDEDCHDLHVGACVEMIYGGQPEKAVILYNRWARFAGYAPITIESLKPLMINIASAILHIEDRKFTVVKCQRQP